ncbi:MAG: sulfite exporter TauE/SafE family protein [Actinomycetota bacterium]
MTPVEWLVASLFVLVGAIVQGSVGFGLGLVSAPVLALIDQRFVPVTPLLLATALTVVVAYREREHIAGRALTWAWIGRVPGTALGLVAVTVFSGDAAAVIFGMGLLAAVLMTGSGRRLDHTRPTLFGAGVLSGVMATAVSVGGPPIALVLIDLPPRRLRGTLSVFFGVGATASLILLALVGQVTRTALVATAALAPAMVVGLIIAAPVTARVPAPRLVSLALTVSAGSAIALVLRGLI